MAWDLDATTILNAIRTTIGSSITVGSGSVSLRHFPETDLWTMPQVTATNYPLVALEVIGEGTDHDQEFGTAKRQALTLSVALHFVARLEDVAATTYHPAEYCRRAIEAIDEKLAATPKLGTSSIGIAVWEGRGAKLEMQEVLRGQGLCEYGSVWSWVYDTARLNG